MTISLSEEGQLVRLRAAYRMIDRDEITARKFGTRWFIPREEIERIAGSERPDGD